MAKTSEPNAQNSELDPKAHPSGSRIEKMVKESSNSQSLAQENRYISPEDPAEGARDDVPPAPHRMDADDREDR